MIGHQTVGLDGQAVAPSVVGQEGQIFFAVGGLEEDVAASIAALRDVMGQAGGHNASDARHAADSTAPVHPGQGQNYGICPPNPSIARVR